MINASAFLAIPMPFKQLCTIYPPTVRDAVSSPYFSQYVKLLTYTVDELKDEYPNTEAVPTPYEFLLINAYHSNDMRNIIKNAFHFFTHEDVVFLFDQKIIVFGSLDELSKITDVSKYRILTEELYFDFQNMIRLSIGKKCEELPEQCDDPMMQRIKDQARRRERLSKKTKRNTKNGLTFDGSLVAICCMGLGITPLNIGEISYAAIDALITMYQQKESYNTDIQSILQGADPKKVKPKYWMREQSDYQEIKI